MENVGAHGAADYAADEKSQYERVLALSLEVGRGLLSSGSSVSRVENAVERICLSYGVAEANVWVIPSLITASIVTPCGDTFTLVERVYISSNNLLKMEKYNQLSRDICYKKLSLPFAENCADTLKNERYYSTGALVMAGASAAGAFSILYGGTLVDALFTIPIGALMAFLSAVLSVKSFNSYARCFMLSLIGGLLCILFTAGADAVGIECHCSNVMIGTIMIVAPGLMVCNAIRDLFVGDLISGTFQILNGILIMLAVVAGYASAMMILRGVSVFNVPDVRTGAEYYIYAFAAGAIGVAGFSLMFVIGLKRLLPATVNALLTYGVLLGIQYYTDDVFVINLFATMFGAIMSELLARITKAPSTVYIIPAIIIPVPGGALYYTLNYLVQGDMELCSEWGLRTALIFLGMAVGLSIVAAVFQLIHPIKHKKRFTEKFFGRKNRQE